jgi:hypothetical protein
MAGISVSHSAGATHYDMHRRRAAVAWQAARQTGALLPRVAFINPNCLLTVRNGLGFAGAGRPGVQERAAGSARATSWWMRLALLRARPP